MAETTNKSYKYAVESDQGSGFIENTGDDWIFPEANTAPMQIFDSAGLSHTLVIDNNDGLIYDLSGREGPTGGGISKYWKDKVDTDDTGGTDVIPILLFGEDEGTFEHFFLKHLESHLYVRPYSEIDGFPTDIEFDLDMFVDGEPTTATATADDIDQVGDIVFDKIVEGHRLQLKVTANMGEHYITGRQQYYIANDRAASPSNKETTEMQNQEAFAQPALWPDIANSLIDRVTGNSITATYTAVDDPTGDTKGLQIASAITFPSVTLGATGAILIWYNGTIALTIGGVAVVLTDHATSGSWTLAYANAVSDDGAVVVTPTGVASIWDLRIFNSAITTTQRTYYYNDVIGNSGNVMIPK